MKLRLEFSHDELRREFPYQIIAETTSSVRWNTGKRKRLWNNLFTEDERTACEVIRKQAHLWFVDKGVPKEGVSMSISTYTLWHKFAEFCASL